MTRMTRLVGLILIVLGVIVGAVGAIPSGLAGRLNGVGGREHLTADGLVLVGALLVLGGLFVALRLAPNPVAQGGAPVRPLDGPPEAPPAGEVAESPPEAPPAIPPQPSQEGEQQEGGEREAP
jgi:hypothetical protein